jgi:hypothetical protein
VDGLNQAPVYADDNNFFGANISTIKYYAETFLQASKEIGLDINIDKLYK